MKKSEFFGFIYVLFVLFVLTLGIITFISNKTKKEFEQSMEFCSQVSSQCGIHNIIDEFELSDVSIDQNIIWLQNDEFSLSDYENECGIKILKYLRKMSYEERENTLRDFFIKYLEDQDG